MRLSYPIARGYIARSRRRRRPPNVLVIAPHPDDDVIGCGGTLQQLVRRGARIRVLYVTDGSASHLKSSRFPPPVLSAIREVEARAALRQLGVWRTPCFLRAPDSGLAQLSRSAGETLVFAIARQLESVRANIVFAPWRRDPHPDHVATAALVEAALACSARRAAVYFYGVWLAVRGVAAEAPRPDEATVCEVPLGVCERELKRTAILEHRSQTGALIDDDPDGFCIDEALLATWLSPSERFYRRLGQTSSEAVKRGINQA